MFKEIKFRTTKKEEIVDITDEVEAVVRESGVEEAGVFVYVPHTTAAVSIHGRIEAERRPRLDAMLEEASPKDLKDLEEEPQTKAAFVAPTEVLVAVRGKLLLGENQRIYFYEFDGPRERSVYVLVVPSSK
ncbi:MAG TPA: YjbQ family protein [Armatimonadetes bacterium]|nr:YjbQ family protein [Armatimonadota bacterium]